MIDISGVSFRYGTGEGPDITALSDLSLKLPAGLFAAIIGRNGSGKSTLLKLLTALLFPSEGQILIDGIEVTDRNRWEIRRRVALVFQDPDNQLVAARVLDDVAFGPENLGIPREEIAVRVQDALAMVGLTTMASALIEDLSAAEKQLTAIAGALAMRPHFLVLDEPTSLLPRPAGDRLLGALRRSNRQTGMGVLHITHHMAEAALFDRVIVLEQGQVAIDGTPREVFRRPERMRDLGLEVPGAVDLAQRLRRRGFDLAGEPVDTAGLRESLTTGGMRRGS